MSACQESNGTKSAIEIGMNQTQKRRGVVCKPVNFVNMCPALSSLWWVPGPECADAVCTTDYD